MQIGGLAYVLPAHIRAEGEKQMARFAVGTKFRSKTCICTVTDIWTTRNLQGDIVKERYVATHDFCGAQVTDCDVVDATIARGMVHEAALHGQRSSTT